MKAKLEHSVCGIYCIKNKVDGKVYIGKAKNIHKRIIKHIATLNVSNPDTNRYLLNAWKKHGRSAFEYSVVEYLPLDEELVAKRELYWMKAYNALNPIHGYNLRSDSDSRLIVHDLTKKKMSMNLKKQWADGIRNEHGVKLKKSWLNDDERKKNQSLRMSKTLTKWMYKLYTLDFIELDTVNYKQLKELKLQNCIAEFHVKKQNKVKHKQHWIVRIKIEDIV